MTTDLANDQALILWFSKSLSAWKVNLINRILLPTDLSPVSLSALDCAIDLAQSNQAEILIVFVIEPIQYQIPPLLIKERQKEAEEQLARVAAKVIKRYPNCRTEVHFGVAHRVIVGLTRKGKADMIVMSMHGSSALHDFLIGNVVERVVRSATCPVLLIPPPTRMKRNG
jgi:nucleotide-binding universal stress UspA family protein